MAILYFAVVRNVNGLMVLRNVYKADIEPGKGIYPLDLEPYPPNVSKMKYHHYT